LARLESSLIGADFSSIRLKLPPMGKVRVRPTLYGWGLLFLIFWVPLTAIATANNFLFIVFIMLVGLAFVSHRLGKKNVNCVEIERRFPDEIFAGVPFIIKYLVKANHQPWGALTLTFAEYPPLEGTGPATIFFRVPPEATTSMDFLAVISTRGYKNVTPGLLVSSFPFGLATYSRQCGSVQQVLVFPNIMPVDEDVPPSVGRFAKGLERVGPFGTVPFHLRGYVSGDPYKHIEWKKTAQTGTLMSKVFSDEEAPEVVVRVPGNASERAISRAASLIMHFSKSGTALKLTGPGFWEGPDRGRKFTRRLLTTLALWEEYIRVGVDPPISPGVVVNVDAAGEFHWHPGGRSAPNLAG
jgi:uncharacterized protein (DUF58 family)